MYQRLMMFSNNCQIYICIASVDMRKAINGLSSLVESHLRKNPFSGQLFVFTNRKKNIVKILYWQGNGFCLWQKTLDKGRFRWPTSNSDALSLSYRELSWLLEGLEIEQTKAHKKLEYKNSY